MRERSGPVWLFDLDNTLHNASPHVFPHINRSMTAYVAAHLRLDEAAASGLREHYWRRYGATLLGLTRHHGVRPDHFLWHTHQFPDLASMLVFERGLRAMLRRLPGRKLLFSNAPAHYAEAVLGHLGIVDCFDALYCIEHLRFTPKPAATAFRALLHAERLRPERCIMVEDTADNLATAKRLGMKTVWVSANTRRPPHVDARVGSVLQLPKILGRL